MIWLVAGVFVLMTLALVFADDGIEFHNPKYCKYCQDRTNKEIISKDLESLGEKDGIHYPPEPGVRI